MVQYAQFDDLVMYLLTYISLIQSNPSTFYGIFWREIWEEAHNWEDGWWKDGTLIIMK